ncbi:GntR family transcriptional regulator [uncultured Paracoccus sp.]|uniref:GntR family transcriptional regulator n=1 Tax=uncultured Paracoccus sp. TaxID=189685 RepID=UPI0026235228|nr:GntR family transcriptional regulator [uncultured Paracoccus sp.]
MEGHSDSLAGLSANASAELIFENTNRAYEELRELIDSADAVGEPLYIRLRRALMECLSSGRWMPGDKLPSEGVLARELGVSLGTVQKVLNSLAQDDVLVRRHGHGTFVSVGRGQSQMLLHFRFVGDDADNILPVYAEFIDRRICNDESDIRAFLQCSGDYIRVRRRLKIANEFECISEFMIDAVRFAEVMTIPEEELGRVVIRNLMARKFNAPTLKLKQYAWAQTFGADVLGLMPRDHKDQCGLVIEVRSFTHQEAPISFQKIYIPANSRPLELLGMDLST